MHVLLLLWATVPDVCLERSVSVIAPIPSRDVEDVNPRTAPSLPGVDLPPRRLPPSGKDDYITLDYLGYVLEVPSLKVSERPDAVRKPSLDLVRLGVSEFPYVDDPVLRFSDASWSVHGHRSS